MKQFILLSLIALIFIACDTNSNLEQAKSLIVAAELALETKDFDETIEAASDALSILENLIPKNNRSKKTTYNNLPACPPYET